MKTYGLAIAKAQSLVALKLPAMTLSQAETARDTLAAMGKSVHVVNLKAE